MFSTSKSLQRQTAIFYGMGAGAEVTCKLINSVVYVYFTFEEVKRERVAK